MANIKLPDCPECNIGDNMIGAFERWVNYGIEPGGFGMAVLTNNLKDAVARADVYNKRNLTHIVEYCIWYLPSICWGNQEKVSAYKYLKMSERAETANMEGTDV